MRKDTVVQLRQPGTFSEYPLTEVLRLGARRLLARAVEMEVTTFVEMHADLTDGAGRRRIVRHGYLPEREIQTGIGPVAVRCPRVRDRGGGEMGPRIRFTSSILPPYLRRAKSIEELLPWLYLKGISTGDFSEALAALVNGGAKLVHPGGAKLVHLMLCVIPTVIDQNPCAHLGMPRDMIFHGWSMRLFQAWQHSATMSS